MKKQRSNNKFLKIAAVSLALLALPPLAVYGQTVRSRAAQPRPALPGAGYAVGGKVNGKVFIQNILFAVYDGIHSGASFRQDVF